MTAVARTFHITGRVQGVAFRAWTQSTARRLGVTGWVRNRPDGGVEGEVQGPEQIVARFFKALDGGPPAARVDTVTTQPATPMPRDGFEILR